MHMLIHTHIPWEKKPQRVSYVHTYTYMLRQTKQHLLIYSLTHTFLATMLAYICTVHKPQMYSLTHRIVKTTNLLCVNLFSHMLNISLKKQFSTKSLNKPCSKRDKIMSLKHPPHCLENWSLLHSQTLLEVVTSQRHKGVW